VYKFALIVAIGWTSTAVGQMQGGWLLSSSNTVSRWRPTTQVELWGWFQNIPGPSPLLAGSKLDLHADEGVFSSYVWHDIYCLKGVPTGSSILGIACVNYNCFAGIIGNTSNPIYAFVAEWTTDDFTPHIVHVRDETEAFLVQDQIGTHCTPNQWDLVALGGFVPGEGVIEVIDACYADCDLSGSLDLFDFLCYVNAFNAANPAADCDESGSLDVFDFLCYVNEFRAGCP
jgi:hypothetical protein